VFVAGRLVPVDRGGRFSADVPVRFGRNPIEVLTEGPSGEARKQTVELAVAASRPADTVQINRQRRPKLDVKWHKRPKIDMKWGRAH
jgi:hypothetical protein